MSDEPAYRSIAAHYEACLARHGDSHLGVDWPDADDAETRHRVMLEAIRPAERTGPLRLLDLGCGASHFYEHIVSRGIEDIEYSGLDISEAFVELSRAKFPANRYWCLDVLTDDLGELPRFDYVVMNGVFTERVDLSFEAMLDFFTRMVTRVASLADVGIAFNVMSSHVDWERDDLFHLPLDTLADILIERISRDFVVRNDYGLYEYTAYAYRSLG